MRDRQYRYGSHTVGQREPLLRRRLKLEKARKGRDTAKLAKRELRAVRPLFWLALIGALALALFQCAR